MSDGEERARPPAAILIGNAHTEDPDVRAYLRAQTRLADLQSEDIERDDGLRHWSLRVRHISDVLRLGFESAVVLLVLAAAVFVGAAVWNAVHDNGLVIAVFSVPKQMAAEGLGGEVVADRLLTKLAVMQQATNSLRPADTYKNDWGGDIQVQIPETGVSLGQLDRYLRQWLGHETHIAGDVYRDGDSLTVTARVGADPAQSFTGKPADLDALLEKAAEAIYKRTQPYRYAVYLTHQGHLKRAGALFRQLASDPSPTERAWAYTGWAVPYGQRGDLVHATALAHAAIRADSDFFLAYFDLINFELNRGLGETAFRNETRAIAIAKSGRDDQLDAADNALYLPLVESFAAQYLGDYASAMRDEGRVRALGGATRIGDLGALNLATNAAGLHDRKTAENMLHALPPVRDADDAINRAFARLDLDATFRRWSASVADATRIAAVLAKLPAGMAAAARPNLWPVEALVDAERGDFAGAARLVARMPAHCTDCVLAAARVAALRKDDAAAARGFARAEAVEPSSPFPDYYWGEMLLRAGKPAAAIAKLAAAHAKSPHFADALERWGEALIAKNRSDLALARFEDADEDAPDWGRLHLEWGEALLWTGDKAAARKQFAIARRLYLTPPEKTALARVAALAGVRPARA